MTGQTKPPQFGRSFRDQLAELFAWRRDVRRFRTDPVPENLIEFLLDQAQLAPSVGNSQPWRWVRVDSKTARDEVRANFERCNASALSAYEGKKAQDYARLKLSGLDDAPHQFAVFCDRETPQGHGLGRQTMPEMLDYSVTGCVMNFWLAARAAGIGVGWVSILDAEAVRLTLDLPSNYKLIAYLCAGFPVEEHLDPELERFGWQARENVSRKMIIR